MWVTAIKTARALQRSCVPLRTSAYLCPTCNLKMHCDVFSDIWMNARSVCVSFSIFPRGFPVSFSFSPRVWRVSFPFSPEVGQSHSHFSQSMASHFPFPHSLASLIPIFPTGWSVSFPISPWVWRVSFPFSPEFGEGSDFCGTAWHVAGIVS